MSEFYTYLQLGFGHIADFNAFDHIVFIVALCAVYQLQHLKNIFILVTAFTIGHSLTLALATLNIIIIPSKIIEFLIPVTIFTTCVYNVTSTQGTASKERININYAMALFFGLIHGMGFSNYLRMLLSNKESIIMPLFSFNVGLEIGQLLIVGLILGILFVAEKIFKVKHREWNLFISGAAAGISLILMSETKFW